MAFEEVAWYARFVVCKECGCLVLRWKVEIHERSCPARILGPLKADIRITS